MGLFGAFRHISSGVPWRVVYALVGRCDIGSLGTKFIVCPFGIRFSKNTPPLYIGANLRILVEMATALRYINKTAKSASAVGGFILALGFRR
jgi:hypothetical protein